MQGCIPSSASAEIAARLPDTEHVAAFMPCTPNPTTGFFFYVARRDIIDLDITVEAAMTLLMSAGLAQPLPARGRERGIARQHQRGVVARGADQLAVGLDAGDPKARHTGLPRAENVAFPAQPEIFFGDAKAVFGLAHDVEPRLSGFAQRSLVEEQAG